MKRLIVIVGILLSFSLFATEEAPWKIRTRTVLEKILGKDWSHKLLGQPPEVHPVNFSLPAIPVDVKKTTDVSSYTKKEKDLTEYDRLSGARKRQFNFKFLQELFQVTRKSEAKDEDLSNWLNTLDQGGSREGIYQALVLDEVYMALENMNEKASSRLTDFSLKFSQKFLNQTFKAESIHQLNLYSLKRILTEKGLDLIEYYETTDLDSLYRWYAIFSADLALKYAPLLKSEVREDPSVTYHYEWAKNMPVQHIKSEFIIKLHMVMNGLALLQ